MLRAGTNVLTANVELLIPDGQAARHVHRELDH
jgi:hypothetical protein